MHSGIGPTPELEALGIPVIHHLPGIGQNLRNHPSVNVIYRENPDLQRDYLTNPIFLRYTAANSDTHRDMTITPNFRPFIDGIPHTSFGIHPELPESKGALSLTSADPQVPPALDYEISHPRDLERMREGVHLSIQLAEHPSFEGMFEARVGPHRPGPSLRPGPRQMAAPEHGRGSAHFRYLQNGPPTQTPPPLSTSTASYTVSRASA